MILDKEVQNILDLLESAKTDKIAKVTHNQQPSEDLFSKILEKKPFSASKFLSIETDQTKTPQIFEEDIAPPNYLEKKVAEPSPDYFFRQETPIKRDKPLLDPYDEYPELTLLSGRIAEKENEILSSNKLFQQEKRIINEKEKIIVSILEDLQQTKDKVDLTNEEEVKNYNDKITVYENEYSNYQNMVSGYNTKIKESGRLGIEYKNLIDEYKLKAKPINEKITAEINKQKQEVEQKQRLDKALKDFKQGSSVFGVPNAIQVVSDHLKKLKDNPYLMTETEATEFYEQNQNFAKDMLSTTRRTLQNIPIVREVANTILYHIQPENYQFAVADEMRKKGETDKVGNYMADFAGSLAGIFSLGGGIHQGINSLKIIETLSKTSPKVASALSSFMAGSTYEGINQSLLVSEGRTTPQTAAAQTIASGILWTAFNQVGTKDWLKLQSKINPTVIPEGQQLKGFVPKYRTQLNGQNVQVGYLKDPGYLTRSIGNWLIDTGAITATSEVTSKVVKAVSESETKDIPLVESLQNEFSDVDLTELGIQYAINAIFTGTMPRQYGNMPPPPVEQKPFVKEPPKLPGPELVDQQPPVTPRPSAQEQAVLRKLQTAREQTPPIVADPKTQREINIVEKELNAAIQNKEKFDDKKITSLLPYVENNPGLKLRLETLYKRALDNNRGLKQAPPVEEKPKQEQVIFKEKGSSPEIPPKSPSKSLKEKEAEEIIQPAAKKKDSDTPSGRDRSGKLQVTDIPIKEIKIDTEKFQGRTQAYSEETVNKIIADAEGDKFQWWKFDPIRLWKDPKSGELKVLAGHSRLESFNRLSKKPGDKFREFEKIPSVIVKAATFEEAQKYALEESNVMGTAETPLERSANYSRMRKEGKPLKEIIVRAKELEGQRNAQFVVNLSYLNPGGKTFDALKNFEKSGSVESSRVLDNIGDWIGKARQQYPQLTDSHEDEMYDFLTADEGINKIKNRTEFVDRIGRIVENAYFNPEVKLNIKDTAIRSNARIDYERKLAELESEMRFTKAAQDKLRKNLLAVNTPQETINKKLQPLEDKIRAIQQDIIKHKGEEGKIDEADKNQGSLFAPSADEVKTTKSSEPPPVITPEDELSALDILKRKPDINKQAVGGGYFEDLADKTKDIAPEYKALVTIGGLIYQKGYTSYPVWIRQLKAYLLMNGIPEPQLNRDLFDVVKRKYDILITNRKEPDEKGKKDAEPEPDIPESMGTGGGGKRPDLIVVNPKGLPEPRSYVGPEQLGLSEQQILGINLALTRFNKGGKGFLLADGTGVGKTRQILVTAQQIKKQLNKPVLIVVPNKTIVEGSYTKDAKELNIDLADFEFITYKGLTDKQGSETKYSLVIWDEAHKLKNQQSIISSISENIQADHILYATATPMDRPVNAVYFLSKILDRSEENIFAQLGLQPMVIQTKGGEPRTVYLYTEGVNHETVLANLIKLRDEAIRNGSMIRRELPFYGHINWINMPFTPEQKAEQDGIFWYYEKLIAASRGRAKMNAAGQQTLRLAAYTEPTKTQFVYDMVKKDLDAGRHIVIVANSINPTFIKGIPTIAQEFDPKAQGAEVPGTIQTLMEKFKKDGIKVAKIFGAGKVSGDVDLFQSGDYKVAIITPEKGGAGINLDDVIGDKPRTAYIMTVNFSGDVFEQILGRFSRATTKSPSQVKIIVATDSIADNKKYKIIRHKLRTLRRIQAGTDPEVASALRGGQAEDLESFMNRDEFRRSDEEKDFISKQQAEMEFYDDETIFNVDQAFRWSFVRMFQANPGRSISKNVIGKKAFGYDVELLEKELNRTGTLTLETMRKAREGSDFNEALNSYFEMKNYSNKEFKTKEDAENWIKEYNKKFMTHFLPITESMRKSVLYEGQPMFQNPMDDIFERTTPNMTALEKELIHSKDYKRHLQLSLEEMMRKYKGQTKKNLFGELTYDSRDILNTEKEIKKLTERIRFLESRVNKAGPKDQLDMFKQRTGETEFVITYDSGDIKKEFGRDSEEIKNEVYESLTYDDKAEQGVARGVVPDEWENTGKKVYVGHKFLADLTPEQIRKMGADEINLRIAQEMADMHKIFRSPNTEVIYLKFYDANKKIVYETAFTSHAANHIALPRSAFRIAAGEASRRGAVGFIELHNHPAGNPTPSGGDLISCKERMMQLKADFPHISYDGSVVINGDEYSFISPETLKGKLGDPAAIGETMPKFAYKNPKQHPNYKWYEEFDKRMKAQETIRRMNMKDMAERFANMKFGNNIAAVVYFDAEGMLRGSNYLDVKRDDVNDIDGNWWKGTAADAKHQGAYNMALVMEYDDLTDDMKQIVMENITSERKFTAVVPMNQRIKAISIPDENIKKTVRKVKPGEDPLYWGHIIFRNKENPIFVKLFHEYGDPDYSSPYYWRIQQRSPSEFEDAEQVKQRDQALTGGSQIGAKIPPEVTPPKYADKNATYKESDLNDVIRLKELSRALIADMSGTIDVNFRTQSVKEIIRKARAVYSPEPGIVRINSLNDFSALTHEIGHKLDHQLFHGTEAIKFKKTKLELLVTMAAGRKDAKIRQKLLDKLRAKHGIADVDSALERYELRKEITNLMKKEGHYSTALVEGFAEATRLYIQNRPALEREAPKYYAFFERLLNNAPEIKRTIDSARDQWLRFEKQDPLLKVAATIQRDKEDKPAWTQAIRDLGNKFMINVVDGLTPFRDLQKELLKISPDLAGARDPLLQVLSILGADGKVDQFLYHNPFSRTGDSITIEKDIKPLMEIITPVLKKGDLYIHEAYLVALRNIELHNRKMPQAATETFDNSRIAVRNFVNQFGKEYAKKFRDELYAYQDAVLRYYQQSGKISYDNYLKMKLDNRLYVPFQRFFEDWEAGSARPNIAQYLTDSSPSPVKAIKGSDREVVSPIGSMIQNTYELIVAADRNIALRTIVQALKEIEPTNVQKLRRVDVVPAPGPSGMNWIFKVQKPKDSAVITVWEDGKNQFYSIPRAYYDSFFSLSEPVSRAIRVLSAPTRVLQAGAVQYNPTFAVRNIFRDQTSGIFYSRYGYNPFYFLQGLTSYIKRDDIYQKFLASGGDQSFLTAVDEHLTKNYLEKKQGKLIRTRVARYFSSPAGLIRLARDINRLSEICTRLGAFTNAFMKSKDVYRAMQEAREISADYAVKGQAMRNISPLLPFFNARIQHGLNKIPRSFKDNPGSQILKGFLWLTVPALLNWWLNNKDDERSRYYQDLPDWRKIGFFNIYVGDGYFISLPKGTYGVLFASLPEYVMDWINLNDKVALTKIMQSLFEETAPGSSIIDYTVPQGGRPLIETFFANRYGFTGREVLGKSVKELPAALQYYEDTPQILRWVGEQINISPIQMNSIIRGYTAGLGQAVLYMGDEAMQAAGLFPETEVDNPKLADVDLTQVPVVRAFIPQKPVGTKSKSVQDFLAKVDEFEYIDKAVNDLIRKNQDASLSRYLSDEQRNKDYVYYNQNKASIKKFREAILFSSYLRKAIKENPLIDDKTASVDSVNKALTDLAWEFRNAYNNGEAFSVSEYIESMDEQSKQKAKELTKERKEFKLKYGAEDKSKPKSDGLLKNFDEDLLRSLIK